MKNVTEFNIKSNWFFENLISPLLYVSFDVSDQVSENTERLLVNRYILDCNTATKETLFDTVFKGKSDIKFEDFQKVLVSNSINYVLDEEIVDIPLRHKQYYGNFDVLKISNQPCNIVLVDQDTCDEKYIIEYRWKSRDTRTPGHYKGKIKIEFMSDIYESGVTYEGGTYIGPIYEELDIFIKD
jgi:hypothetical protein